MAGIDSIFLRENPEARAIHSQGLEEALAGNFDTAHDMFAQAIGALGEETGTLFYDRARQFQWDLIDRDDGFTYVREAIAKESPESLWIGERLLAHSADDLEAIGREARLFLPKYDRKRLYSEIGQTRGLQARAVTVEAVKFDDEVEIPLNDYRAAYSILARGLNQYFTANHAMAAARAELIARGHSLKLAQWVAIAAIAGAKSALADTSNTLPAVKTVVGRLPSLKSQEAARASVIEKP